MNYFEAACILEGLIYQIGNPRQIEALKVATKTLLALYVDGQSSTREAIDKCLVNLGQVEGEAYEEAEPMAVLVMPMPRHCFNCKLMAERLAHGPQCFLTREDVRSDGRFSDCPLHEAIGIITPDGQVKYLREEEE